MLYTQLFQILAYAFRVLSSFKYRFLSNKSIAKILCEKIGTIQVS